MTSLQNLGTAFAMVALALPIHAQAHASETPAPRAVQILISQPIDRSAAQPSAASTAADPSLAQSRVFRVEDMPARTSPNGAESRRITHGTLPSGESVNLHESTQPPKAEPVALHTIHHTEFVCVQQGELTFDHVDAAGKTISEKAGPGSVIYVATGTNHRLRNTGTGPASYTVVAIGGDAK